MKKIKHVDICYWYQRQKENPVIKRKELEEELASFFHEPFFYNELESSSHFSIPRVTVSSSDKQYYFAMSLINASLMMEVISEDNNAIILEINNNIQYFYDVLKKVYNLDIIYTSIKISLVDEMNNPLKEVQKLLRLPEEKYESLVFKKGIIKDDYYINYNIESSKEYNFNILEHGLNQEDLIDSTMLISLSKAQLNRKYLFLEIEINDRYVYNQDNNYRTAKTSMRGMILELKRILNEIEKK